MSHDEDREPFLYTNMKTGQVLEIPGDDILEADDLYLQRTGIDPAENKNMILRTKNSWNRKWRAGQ